MWHRPHGRCHQRMRWGCHGSGVLKGRWWTEWTESAPHRSPLTKSAQSPRTDSVICRRCSLNTPTLGDLASMQEKQKYYGARSSWHDQPRWSVLTPCPCPVVSHKQTHDVDHIIPCHAAKWDKSQAMKNESEFAADEIYLRRYELRLLIVSVLEKCFHNLNA